MRCNIEYQGSRRFFNEMKATNQKANATFNAERLISLNLRHLNYILRTWSRLSETNFYSYTSVTPVL